MLTDEERRTQTDITEAYRWIFRVTAEADVMLTDATRLMTERALEDDEGLKTYYGQKPPPGSWPYVYSFTRVFLDRDEKVKAAGIAAFLAVSLGNERQKFEPRLYGGIFRWTGADAQKTHNPVYYGAIDGAFYKRFVISGDAVFRGEPNDAGRQYHKGVDGLRWFSLPLAWVSTPDRLVSVVDAVVALRTDKEDRACALVAETRS